MGFIEFCWTLFYSYCSDKKGKFYLNFRISPGIRIKHRNCISIEVGECSHLFRVSGESLQG